MSRLFVFLIKCYQAVVSPIFNLFFRGGCRFTPTCSQYTIDAVYKYGLIKGVALGTKRILRCQPWGSAGYDPI